MIYREIARMPSRKSVEAFLREVLPGAGVVSESTTREPYYYEATVQRWGTPERGIEFTDRTDEYEQGSRGAAYEQRYSLTSYGYDPPLLLARIHDRGAEYETGDIAIREAFEAWIGPPLEASSPERLDRLAHEALRSIRSGAWRSALELASEVLAFRPDDIEMSFALGLANAALGDFKAADPLLRKVLARDPKHVDALYSLGNIRLEQRDAAGAAELLQRAVTIDARNHPAFARLGVALESMGRFTEAAASYRKAVELSPNAGSAFGYNGLDFTIEAKQALERLTR
jgi:tetratricopeptide (TPR) repeat protein